MPRHVLLVLAGVAILAAGCGDRKELPFDPTTGVPDPTATFVRVQGEVLTPSCALAGCHAGAAPASGLDLSLARSYASLVRVASSQRSDLNRVEPGDAERSYLVKKIRGDADVTGSRMPLGGSPLSAAQIKLVTDWVRRGAPRD